MSARTLLDKIWDAHVVVAESADTPAVLYVDLHLLHEVTSPQAFAALAARGLPVRRPERTVATMDHSTPTTPRGADGSWPGLTDAARAQIEALAASCAAHGIRLHAPGSGRRGIVHVIGPELGLTLPGSTIVCGDSHTSTHGAFGALAFGIGTTEVGHVLASQCLLQRKPKSTGIELRGALPRGTGAKDVALAVVRALGPGGGAGSVLEYRGDSVRALDMEQRMTLCNMSIEAGARAGMIGADAVTADFLQRLAAPEHAARVADAAAHCEQWRADPDASYDTEHVLDVSHLAPQVTYGTHPGMAIAVDERVPPARDALEAAALDYMGLTPGRAIADQRIDVAFIGSCTNGRLGDLRAAAAVLRGRRVADGVRLVVVPGSEQVQAAAEAEGIAAAVTAAGGEWREPGCSMCIAMNGDRVEAGSYAISTSNRNFAGRQGPGARTLLASPLVAAASAVKGHVADPRPMIADRPETIHA